MEKDYTLEDAPFHLDTDGPGYNALFLLLLDFAMSHQHMQRPLFNF